MTNGNTIVWICLLFVVAGASWIGFRILTDSPAGRHEGALDIGSTEPGRGTVHSGAAPAGGSDLVTPIETVGALVVVRPGRREGVTTALEAFDAGAESRPLRGSVRDEEGEPVAGARIAVRLRANVGAGRVVTGQVVGSTLSDESGGFTLEGFVRLGERYALDVTHDLFARTRVDLIDPLAPATMTRDVVLTQGVTLRGTVTSAEAGVLAGVDVLVFDLQLLARNPDGVEERRATTRRDGTYEIGRLCPGLKRVVVRTAGFASAQRSPLRLRESAHGIDFALSVGRFIAGHVVDGQTNTGIANATVRATAVSDGRATVHAPGSNARMRPSPTRVGETVRTAADGSFRIEGLDKGLHLVAVVDGPGAGATTNASVGEDDVVLSVRLKGVVRGRVIDADTGAPVTRFSVALARGERSAAVPAASLRRIADDSGAFELIDVAPGLHHVVVTAPGYSRGSSMPIQTGLGERVSGVEVRLQRGLVVHGRVMDVGGAPIPGASVLIIEEVDLPASRTHPAVLPQRRVDTARASVSTFADGSFLVPNQGRGRFHFRVDHPDYQRVETRSFELYGSEDVFAVSDVVLEAGAVVTGVVSDEAGRPDHAAIVTALPDRSTGSRVVIEPSSTDGEGRYLLRGLGPGRWNIVVTQRAGRMQLEGWTASDARPVELTAGERRRVDFRKR